MSDIKTAMSTSFSEIFFSKKRKLHEKDFAWFLIEKLEQDIKDALQNPEIAKDCLESALDNIFSLKQDLRGE